MNRPKNMATEELQMGHNGNIINGKDKGDIKWKRRKKNFLQLAK